ncbi:MAG: EAL domain-containing protein [Chromatiales bacterium]|nr:EAL domain-containing protein [Chromatiales bacterium]
MEHPPSFFLGRQPILDRRQNTVAYELLFRAGFTAEAAVADDVAATSSVIAHAFGALGIDAVLGPCRGFINFDAGLLMSDVVELLPAERTVVELLETIDIDSAVIDRCHRLRRQGFQLALDDVTRLDAGRERVLPLIDVVKVDIPATPTDEVATLVNRLRRPGVQLLAEKVDTRAQADWCLDLGFDLFQGYYFARPMLLQGRRADPDKTLLLKLLQLVLNDADNDEIVSLLKHSPELIYKLLRLVNSVSMGLRSPVQSLAHALVVLGRRQLQRWVQVLLFAHHGAGDFPSPLLTMAATRGRLMELLSEQAGFDGVGRDRAFMTGLLSLLDALLGEALADVIAPLGLPDEVVSALLHRQGRLGDRLRLVEALEAGDDGEATALLDANRTCAVAELPALQVAAMAWANDIVRPVSEN